MWFDLTVNNPGEARYVCSLIRFLPPNVSYFALENATPGNILPRRYFVFEVNPESLRIHQRRRRQSHRQRWGVVDTPMSIIRPSDFSRATNAVLSARLPARSSVIVRCS